MSDPRTDSAPGGNQPTASGAADGHNNYSGFEGATEDFGIGPGGADPLIGADIGGITIVRLIGQGGMGRVYEARQVKPSRPVAVKVIRPGVVSVAHMRRFDHEAEILARLRHPGIAQIHTVGTYHSPAGDVPFFVMEYISDATPLVDYADHKRLSSHDRLELFRKVCDAVAHGHARGVVHRDLKPSNILVDAAGQPKVIDFGVAKTTDVDLALTTMRTDVGQLIGTLQYMSPEQFDGQPDDVDVRSDVYALGIVLYELLSGQPPYDVRRKAVVEAARVVREEDPTPLSSLNRTLRRDVGVIAGKCLAKEPGGRYSSAAELGADVGRYLAGEPIHASPPRFVDGVVRLARRHKSAAAAVSAAAVSLVIAVVGISLFAARAERERARADQQATDAERQLYLANLYRLGRMIVEDDFANAKRLLNDTRRRGLARTSAIELSMYEAILDQSLFSYAEHSAELKGVAFSPDGMKIATASVDGTVRLWDTASGKTLATLRHDDAVTCVTFSPRGDTVATGCTNGKLFFWNATTAQIQTVLIGHKGQVFGIAFHPDGTLLASVSWDRTVRIWRSADGELLHTLRGHTQGVHAVAFSPDGKTLVTGGWDFSVLLWNVETAAKQSSWKMRKWVHSVTFSPCGTKVAIGTMDNKAVVRSLDGKIPDVTCDGHLNEVFAVAFSPDGACLATAARDGSIRLWDSATGSALAVLPGHADAVVSLGFSPDGRCLASASWDGTARIWDADCRELTPRLRGHTSWVNALAFSQDGRWLASASWDRTVRIWSVDKAQEIACLKGHEDWVFAAAFSPDGLLLATGAADKTVRLWSLLTGKQVAKLEGHHDQVFGVAFSPDGLLLASGGRDNSIRLWRLPVGSMCATVVRPKHWVHCVTFSPDGRRIAATGGGDTPIRFIDLDGTLLAVMNEGGPPTDVLATSRDGNVMATGDHASGLTLWDANTLARTVNMVGHGDKVVSLAFNSDDTRILSGSVDHTARIWDVKDGLELVLLKHPARVRCVGCSPVEAVFAIAGEDQEIALHGRSRASIHAARLRSAEIRNRITNVVVGWLAEGDAAIYRGIETAQQRFSVADYHEARDMVLAHAASESALGNHRPAHIPDEEPQQDPR